MRKIEPITSNPKQGQLLATYTSLAAVLKALGQSDKARSFREKALDLGQRVGGGSSARSQVR